MDPQIKRIVAEMLARYEEEIVLVVPPRMQVKRRDADPLWWIEHLQPAFIRPFLQQAKTLRETELTRLDDARNTRQAMIEAEITALEGELTP